MARKTGTTAQAIPIQPANDTPAPARADEAPDAPEAKPGLTKFGRTLATAGGALLFLGLAFGAFPYLLCALLLLGAAFAARTTPPIDIAVSRAFSSHDVRTGEPVDVVVEVTNHGGPLGMSLHDRVPEAFLLDDGSNFEAAWVEKDALLSYRLRAPRRGKHAFRPLHLALHDPTFLQSTHLLEMGERDDVVVHPKTQKAPRIRAPSAYGRSHVPGMDRAMRGIRTNDFRELRPYTRGDPLKQVNWKATARQSRGDELSLIVNEYEVEGKQAIWVFVDASPYTTGGTTLESMFDELATGALAVAGHYLDMGHRVGVTIYGSGPTRVLYPDVGDLQERRIQATLANAEPGIPGEGISEAVEASKGFLAREKPLIFVFTLAGRDANLSRALVSARAIASSGRRPAPVVAIAPLGQEDGSPAARIVAIHEKAQLKGLERRGVTVIRYDPATLPLQAMLAKGVFG